MSLKIAMVKGKAWLAWVCLVLLSLSGCMDLGATSPDQSASQDPCPTPGEGEPGGREWSPVGHQAGQVPRERWDPDAGSSPFAPPVQYRATPSGDPGFVWHIEVAGRVAANRDSADVEVGYASLNDSTCSPHRGSANVSSDPLNGTFSATVEIPSISEMPGMVRLEVRMGGADDSRQAAFDAAILVERVPGAGPESINSSRWADATPTENGNETGPCPERQGGFYADPYFVSVRPLKECGANPRPLGYDTSRAESEWWPDQ